MYYHILKKCVETFSKCLCINAMGIFKNPQSLPSTQRVKILSSCGSRDLLPYKWFLPLRNYIAGVVLTNQVLGSLVQLFQMNWPVLQLGPYFIESWVPISKLAVPNCLGHSARDVYQSKTNMALVKL